MANTSYVRYNVTDWIGRAIQNASVFVYQTGTTTPVSLFDQAAGAIGNPVITNQQGEVVFFLSAQQTVDLKITDNGDTAVIAATGDSVTFADITEVIVPTVITGGSGGNHASTHAAAGADPVTLTQAQITGLAAALANALVRANHTGAQSADTLTDGAALVAMTVAERTKLAGISPGAGSTGLYHIRWDTGTTSWPARPTGVVVPVVAFISTQDATADTPADANLQIGDIWYRHPDAV